MKLAPVLMGIACCVTHFGVPLSMKPGFLLSKKMSTFDNEQKKNYYFLFCVE